MTVLSTVLLAAAVMVLPGAAVARSRLPAPALDASGASETPVGGMRDGRLSAVAACACWLATAVLLGDATGVLAGAVLAVAVYVAAQRARRGKGADPAADPLELAGAWDLLAACLRAGMSVPVALRAVAEGLSAPAGPALRRTAELLALGADLEQAWQPALDCPSTMRLARAARRSGHSGAALAESLTELAEAVRAGARERSEARAQRAGVLIAGPLGLCFLPAFLAIGVVPVVIGLAQGLMQQW
jgi:pilus assembly protein TadC